MDITILESAAPIYASLVAVADTDMPQKNAEIRIVGFPQWTSLADRLSVYKCSLAQVKVVSAVTHFLTNGSVRQGNSGGPILDDNGMVIGVALFSAQHLAFPNAGVHISHISDVNKQPSTPLQTCS